MLDCETDTLTIGGGELKSNDSNYSRAGSESASPQRVLLRTSEPFRRTAQNTDATSFRKAIDPGVMRIGGPSESKPPTGRLPYLRRGRRARKDDTMRKAGPGASSSSGLGGIHGSPDSKSPGSYIKHESAPSGRGLLGMAVKATTASAVSRNSQSDRLSDRVSDRLSDISSNRSAGSAAGSASLRPTGNIRSAGESELTEFFKRDYLKGKAYEGKGYTLEQNQEFHFSAYRHNLTGIQVWAEALDLRCLDDESPCVVRYHYNTGAVLDALLADRTKSAALMYEDLVDLEANFGYGVYATKMDPEQFNTKEAALLNRCWPFLRFDAADGGGVHPQIAGPEASRNEGIRTALINKELKRGRADCCIAILVPERLVFDLWTNWPPPDLKAQGVRIGCDREGRRQAASIDLSVVQASPERLVERISELARCRVATLQKRVKGLESRLGAADDATLAAMCDHAWLLQAAGKTDAARELMRQTVERSGAFHGGSHPSALSAVASQAALLLHQQVPQEAEPLARRALAGRQASLGQENRDTLDSKHRLGVLLLELDKLEEAEEQVKGAYLCRERVLGPAHPDTLKSCHSLAMVYQALGEPDRAHAMVLKAVDARERTLGKAHPDFLSSLNLLGSSAMESGELAAAEAIYQRALEVVEETRHPEDLDMLMTVNNLLSVLHQSGKLKEAEELAREAIEISMAIYGESEQTTLMCVDNLTALLEEQGKDGEAEEWHRYAVEQMEFEFGRDHEETLSSKANLALLMQKRGKLAEAEQLFRAALLGRQRTLGLAHADTFESTHQLGSLLQEHEKHTEAEELYRAAAEMGEKTLGLDHADTLGVLNDLVASLHSQGKVDDAVPIAQRTLEALERLLGANHPATVIMEENLSVLMLSKEGAGSGAPRSSSDLKRLNHIPEDLD